jgi:hypothetical protein
MIFLSKKGTDEYINLMAKGLNAKPTSTEEFDYSENLDPIVLRGILKKRIMRKCRQDGRDFYYVDTGYFGNEKGPSNPSGWKYWHRIVKNELQHGEIIDRPDDRFKMFDKKIQPFNRTGRSILIAMPDDKPMKHYDVDKKEWLEQTINKIKQHTDRPIIVRDRAKLRIHRINSTLEEALNDNIFALVTFNSIAATESIFFGIPAFTLAPCNAASPVSSQDLSQINTPYYPDLDKVYKWACHLAYGQYHYNELKDGSWWRKINES